MATDTSISTATNNNGASTAAAKAKKPEKLQATRTLTPPVDIYENTDELLLVADMPGVPQDGVIVNLEKNELLIEGKRAKVEAEGRPLAIESEELNYRRSFLLPKGIDAEKISAELRNGVLRVHVPKAAAVKPRQIQVKVG